MPGGCLWIDFTQDIAHDFIVGLLIDVMDVDIADNPLLVDDKDGSFRFTILGSEHAIFFGDSPVRPKIAEQGIIDPAQAFGPGLDTGYVIYANAQNLGVQSRKLGPFSLVRRDLTCSDGCPGKRIKYQNHILPTQVAEGECFPQVRR